MKYFLFIALLRLKSLSTFWNLVKYSLWQYLQFLLSGEFFTNCNYKDLILRTILCLILFSCYQSFLNKSIEHSFVFSNNLYKMSAAEDSSLVKAFKKWKKNEGHISKNDNYMDSFWDFLKKNILVPVGDFVSVLMWFFIYSFFMILKITYSVTFYLLYIFLPIQALLSIFGPTSSSLRGALTSYFTLMLTPVVTVVIFDYTWRRCKYGGIYKRF